MRVLILATRHVGDRTSGADLRLIRTMEPNLRRIEFAILHAQAPLVPIEPGFRIDLGRYIDRGAMFCWDRGGTDWRRVTRLPGPMIYLPGKEKWIKKVYETIRTFKPDVLQCDLLQACVFLPRELRRSALAFGQDSLSRFSRTRALNASHPLRRLVFSIDASAYRFAERCYESYPVAVFLSPADLQELRGCTRGIVIRLGVDAKEWDPLPEEPTIGFGGNLSYLPNVEGVREFVNRYWEALRKMVPDIRFIIAGRSPDPSLRVLSRLHEGITVEENPDDLGAVLRRARVIVSPVSWGSGQKNKILEALAISRPVLCDSHMIEGTELQDGVHLVVARATSDWTEGLVSLLRSSERLESLRRSGYMHVRDHCSWSEAATRLADIYRSVAES